MKTLTVCSLAILLLQVQAPGQNVLNVGVRKVTTTLWDSSDPDFLTLSVHFDAILRKQTFVALHIAPAPVFLTQVDRRRGDVWETLFTSSWYDTGDVKYQDCRPFGSGETFEFPQVKVGVFLRRNDKDAHSRLVVRFHLQAACKEGDKRFIQPLLTEPVELVIPHW